MTNLSRRAVAVSTVAATVATLIARPARAQTETKPIAQPRGPWTEDGFIERGGMKIHYVGMGSGPAVIMLHKLGGWAADWRHIAPEIAKTHRVIAIDMPGHGDSTVTTPPPYVHTLAESAAIVMAVIEELGIETFDLVGNSMGGVCSTLIAGIWPKRVKHLVIISSSVGEAVSRDEMKNFGGENYTPDGLPIPRTYEQLKKRFGSGALSIQVEQNDSRAKAGKWVLASARGVATSDSITYLPRITAPVLLLWGENGSYKEFVEGIRVNLKRGRIHYVSKSGSFTHQDNPGETAEVMAAFFKEPA